MMDKELASRLYRTMLRIRRFEETVGKLFYRGQIPGFVHLYIGQEAVAAGVCEALRAEDFLTSTHRGHGHVLAKGADTKAMIAELFGKSTGLCQGKGGSMHLADIKLGILGANGIIAAGAPLATGAAFGAMLKGKDLVGVTFFGDAAANQGVLWESLNLASVWNIPAIFVLENNGYSEWTPTHELSSTLDFADRASGWNVQGVTVDGNDVWAVYTAAKRSVDQARAGGGPTLLVCNTYRFTGHNEGEDAFIGKWSYRSKEEYEDRKKLDPITRFEKVVMQSGLLTRADLDRMDAEAVAEMEVAVDYARNSTYPAPEAALEGLFLNE